MDRNIYIYIYLYPYTTRRLHHSPLISIIMGMMSCFLNSFSHDCVSHLRVLVCTHSYTSFTTRLHHYEDDHFLFLANFCFKFLHDSFPLISNFLCLSLHIHHAPPISTIMEMISFSFPSFFLFLIIPFFPYRFFSHFWVTVLVFISLVTSFTSHFHHDGKKRIPLIILSFSHVFPLSYLSHGFQVSVYTWSSFTTHLYTFFFPSSLFLFLMFVSSHIWVSKLVFIHHHHIQLTYIHLSPFISILMDTVSFFSSCFLLSHIWVSKLILIHHHHPPLTFIRKMYRCMDMRKMYIVDMRNMYISEWWVSKLVFIHHHHPPLTFNKRCIDVWIWERYI